MEPLSRAEIESSVDSFPDLDYKFEHIDWADIMDAEEGSNPEQKLETLEQKSYIIRSSPFINQTPVSLSAMPALTSLRLDDNSRGLPPLQLERQTDRHSNGPNPPTSFSGVLNTQNQRSESTRNNTSPSISSTGVFKVPAPSKQTGRLTLEGLKPLLAKDRKSSTLRPPPSPSSIHEKKRLKISNNSFSRDWDYVDDDFIFTTDSDITPTNYNSFRLPIPHSASVSTLESDTEIETSSAYSETSSTSTLTSKGAKRRERLPRIEDPKKLDQRQKQIDYGKNTEGYINYIKLYPKFKRTQDMPKTPDKMIGYSHRRWLGLLTKWRKSLHQFDVEGPPKSTPPKTESIPMHLEDANTFPTITLKQDPEDVNIKTETMDEEIAIPFSYSSVVQNRHGKIDSSPIPSPQKDISLEYICAEHSTENPHSVSIEEETPTGCRTYSAVLKASKPIPAVPQPTSSLDPLPIKLIPNSDILPIKLTPSSDILPIKLIPSSNILPIKQETKEVDNISQVKQSEIASGIQGNIPILSKPTYCQVLMAHKPLNPVTSPSLQSGVLREQAPLPPEEAPLPQDPDSDDSMEVDPTPTPNIPIEESKHASPQPLTYSQALRSKPPPIVLNTNCTAESEHQLERNNQMKECVDFERTGPCSVNEDIVRKVNEKECKIELCENPPPEQTPPTYSQVLSGISSPPIVDKGIETDPEDGSLGELISKSADIPPTSPLPPTSYRHLIPQGAIVSIQEQS